MFKGKRDLASEAFERMFVANNDYTQLPKI